MSYQDDEYLRKQEEDLARWKVGERQRSRLLELPADRFTAGELLQLTTLDLWTTWGTHRVAELYAQKIGADQWPNTNQGDK